MKAEMLVARFDLNAPEPVWGLENFHSAAVLVRNHGVPLGWLYVSGERSTVLTREQLMQLASDAGFRRDDTYPAYSNAAVPGITVVVCTRDRPMALQGCLESLQQLRYPNFEVVIVDNASRSSETKELVSQRSFRYVREERPGLDWARNCGLQTAAHEIVAYTDDDVRVDPDWLRGIAMGFQDPRVACVTGLVCPAELRTSAQIAFEHYGGMGKGLKARFFDPAKMNTAEVIGAHGSGVGANMAFRRDVLLGLGGFDPHLDVGTPSHGGGDLDIFHRVLVAGYVISYEPIALVWHLHRRSMPALSKQIYDNGRSFGCYLLKIASTQKIPRTAVVRFAILHWLFGWLLKGLIKGGPGRSPWLVGAETWGALNAPWAFWKSYGRLPLVSRLP